MKILFVSSGRNSGKPSPIVSAQGSSLIEMGLAIDYFTIGKTGALAYLKATIRLYRFLRKHKYDIVHAHYGLSALVVLLAKSKEKIIVSFMGDDLLGTNKKDGALTVSSRLFAALNNWLAKKVYHFSIVKSKEMANKLNTTKKVLIPNGVDTKKFYPKDKTEVRGTLQMNRDEKIALFVSDPSRPEKNYNFVVNVLKTKNLLDVNLIVLKDIPHDQLVDYYNAADVLLLASFHEGSPNVIKEAMACNCPIVTTNVGDVEWVIAQTQGCYISSFEIDDYTEKVKEALSFSMENGKTKGRDRIFEIELDATSVAEKIKGVYRKVLNFSSGKTES